MKYNILIFFLGIFTHTGFSQTASLTITFEGLRSQRGNILLGLYDKADGFGARANMIAWGKIVAKENPLRYTFENLKPGDYAISSFHDANSDNEINTNLVGYPKENYGFSNNVFGAFGSIPDFENAKVVLKEGEKREIVIRLK